MDTACKAQVLEEQETDQQRALDLLDHYLDIQKKGGTVYWEGLPKKDRGIFEKAGWNKGIYEDSIRPELSKADPIHDPVTYIEIVVVGGGLLKAGAKLLMSLAPSTSIGVQNILNDTKSTGRNISQNLREQLAMDAAKADPEAGSVVPLTMGDPRWPVEAGWVKMQQIINGIRIDYVRNTITGEVADFKFKY